MCCGRKFQPVGGPSRFGDVGWRTVEEKVNEIRGGVKFLRAFYVMRRLY